MALAWSSSLALFVGTVVRTGTAAPGPSVVHGSTASSAQLPSFPASAGARAVLFSQRVSNRQARPPPLCLTKAPLSLSVMAVSQDWLQRRVVF